MIGDLMTKQQHNIDLINQILRLNIPLITSAVRSAIHKNNISDGDRPTNSDLLFIVFECLSSYLDNLNLQQVQDNDQCLIDKINQIGQILKIVNIKNHLKYADYTFRISDVISQEVSNKMVSFTATGVYVEAEQAFKNHDKHLYTKLLGLITKVTRITDKTAENALSKRTISFWFEEVFPIMFDSNNEIQDSAITAIETVLPFLQLSSYQEHPGWSTLERRITYEYSNAVIALRDNSNSKWYKTWNILVKMLNKKLLKGSLVINKFLSICEHGFRSPSLTIRAETFLCWKVLLEIYAQDTKYLSAKRIKLLVIPFKPPAKSLEIALNKFLVWWSLICKIADQIDQYYDMILVPFLWFCFRLTDKPILSDRVNHDQRCAPLITLKISALINFLGPTHDATKSMPKLTPIEQIDEPLVLSNLLENVGRFLINSCGEATWLIKDIECVDSIQICDNLWSNMMTRMAENKDSTLTELIIQNLGILGDASQDDESAKRLIAHVTIFVLSSKHLIPINISNDIIFGIMKRISLLLTNNIITFNDDELQNIIDNVFSLSSDTQRLQLIQKILTLLQSQKLSSNRKVGLMIWIKAVNYILDHLASNIKEFKETTYEYSEWAVKNSTISHLSIFITIWNNLVRLLKENDTEDNFWQRIGAIIRLACSESDTRIYKLVSNLFRLINPTDTSFPSQFKCLIEFVVQSAPSSHIKELETIIDDINNFSDHISGRHSSDVFRLLNDLVSVLGLKCEISLTSQFSRFHTFRTNYKKFFKTSKSLKMESKEKITSKDDDFVFIPSQWQFRPENLTEHQKEKLKEKRDDIPALYNDMSQSQDSHSVSLKPWTAKQQSHFDGEPIKQISSKDNSNLSVNPTESKELMDGSSGNELVTSQQLNNNENTTVDADNTYSTDTLKERTALLSTLFDASIINANATDSTNQAKIDAERKKKRVQNELNKLQLALNNAAEYSQVQGRTRRTSLYVVKTDVVLRKRSGTTEKPLYPKRGRNSNIKNSPKPSDKSIQNESIIEASQSLVNTPKRKRTSRIMKDSSAKKIKLVTAEDSVSPSISNNANVVGGMIDEKIEQDIKESVANNIVETTLVTVEQTNASINIENDKVMREESTDDSEKEYAITVMEVLPNAELLTSTTVAVPEKDTKREAIEGARSTATSVASDELVMLEDNIKCNQSPKPLSVNGTSSTEEVAIPIEETERVSIEGAQSTEISMIEEQNDHELIEDAQSASAVIITDQGRSSPVTKPFDVSNISPSILTSPSLNQNASKTSELLNSTVNISPILPPKLTRTPRNLEALKKLSDYQVISNANDQNIPTDQLIKRTELDSLIKPPLDTMLQIQRTISTPESRTFGTPKSHKALMSTPQGFQLHGRGAQLLHIIKIRNIEEASIAKVKPFSRADGIASTPTESIMTIDNNILSDEDILANNKDLFRFEKALPSAQASPSSSIMKRSVNEGTESDDVQTPPSKPKRVSFHDPPVSATKEFIRYSEEISSSRCRVIRSAHMRNMFTRKNRTESSKEINKFSLGFDGMVSNKSGKNENSSLKSRKWSSLHCEREYNFANKDALLQRVFEEYSMEDICTKYLESGSTLNAATVKVFTKQITNSMKNDDAIRKSVLEDLSENFHNEFLNVTLQENILSSVIQRIPVSNMLDYIFNQATLNDNIKMQIMEKFASLVDVLQSTAENEMPEELHKIFLQILSHKLSGTQILEALDIIFEKRRTNCTSGN